MKHALLAAATLALTLPASAQEAPEGAPSPNQIVDGASAEEWVVIPPEDLLVMTLAPDAEGNTREVVIQLMPAPFSQGWVSNIKTLARAEWYDGITVNRVQDNYVVQWGDPGHDNPESGETETKPLPEGLKVMGEDEYTSAILDIALDSLGLDSREQLQNYLSQVDRDFSETEPPINMPTVQMLRTDSYADRSSFLFGWPLGFTEQDLESRMWPVHCYGMVGVGRSYSPDTGSGAELYTVIGHSPRHLDRNIALVGRIIAGMEHLSSLPRGSGALGFYTEEEAGKRTPILSIRVAADLSEEEQPQFEYLSTESESFVAYTEARANRRDPFFIVPAGGADICNIPVPIREVMAE